ncbi:MAG: ATP-grasp domain-containing protein, partial [Bradyrhizobium sp.]
MAGACDAAAIMFCGPPPRILEQLGDKIVARQIAEQAGVPVLPGSSQPLEAAAQASELAKELGYPVLLKAAKGGGGRGMRVVNRAEDIAATLEQAQREANSAFGSPDVFLEKFIARPRHIEVQLMGDKHGNLVHLFERDCSIQRRHQKVVEIAPAINLDRQLRDDICEAALTIGRAVNYESAGTVEFLVDAETGKFFFIEVNPRIQVEHTCTEQVTGVDLVKCQLLVAQGKRLDDPEIGLGSQKAVRTQGYAIQCRITTEDPLNNFRPDYGRVAHYRSTGGPGVR